MSSEQTGRRHESTKERRGTATAKERDIYRSLARHHAGLAEAYKHLHRLREEELANTTDTLTR